jgi:hypothetical protein
MEVLVNRGMYRKGGGRRYLCAMVVFYCLRYRYLFVGEKAGWYDVAKKNSNWVWIPATKMTVSSVCLYSNVGGESCFISPSTVIAGLVRKRIFV